jgi:TonB-linked SusC/RagA family outer membrane protein
MYKNYTEKQGVVFSNIYKILFIMRVIAFLLFAAIMQVSASTHAQKLTYVQKNASLEQLFKEIKKQTGYNIVWYEGKLNPEWSVNANFRKTPLKEVMNIALTGMQLDYTISNKTVVIKEKEMSLMDKLNAAFSNIVVNGRVVDENGAGLQGASVKLKNTNKVTITDVDGHFTLTGVPEKAILVISYLGYETKEVEASEKIGTLQLVSGAGKLNEVEVVSTGYQDIPKERATGAFEQINNEIIDRKVGSNILNRLDGVSSILFDKRDTQFGTRLQLRGMYSLTQEINKPLIIVDNFPFEGDINNLNPNDVENITLLKDANASSIWGTRSGNGVIVITTKKGKYNQPMTINFAANLTISEKTDLFKIPTISSSDFIDLEIMLFEKGFYNNKLNDPLHSPVSEVVEILNSRKLNKISKLDSANQIDILRKYDVRNDFDKYIYRNALNQQYSFDLSTGGDKLNYRFSLGYDKINTSLIGNQGNRKTIRFENNVKISKKLSIHTGLGYTLNDFKENSPGDYFSGSYKTGSGYNLSPYARLADNMDNSLPISKQYLMSYLDTLGGGKLLNWQYKPLDEIKESNNNTKSQTFIADIGLKYNIIKGLYAELKYQYQRINLSKENEYNLNTFYARNLINDYTNLRATNALEKYPVPLGGILDMLKDVTDVNNLRGQLNYEQRWKNNHFLSIMTGAELRDNHQYSSQVRFYGYDQRLNISKVDYTKQYNTYQGLNTQVPSDQNSFTDFTSRYLSAFGNINYTYNDKYSLFFSARKDGSNLFGIKTKNKWNPLWSLGLAWDISKENIYNSSYIPYLKLRASYGLNGNVYLGQSAYTTINYLSSSDVTNVPSATIRTPPNPNLRWEQIQTINIGMDLRSKNNLITVNLDYYKKQSSNVFGLKSLDPTTGISSVFANSANISGSGFEIQVNSSNVNTRNFKWRTGFQINNSTYKLKKYLLQNQSQYGFVSDGQVIIAKVGYTPYSVVSYHFNGLDPKTGQPQGILNGKITMNYDSISTYTKNEDQVIHGSAVPTTYGNILNMFEWKKISLSINLTYKLGYFFRKSTINYFTALNLGQVNNDYLKRWQKSGDETTTNIPSLIYPINNKASSFYQNSDINVGKGDHVRIGDFRVAYNINKNEFPRLPFSNSELFFYSGLNILLWKANKFDLDPDYPAGIVPPKSFALGLKITL